MGYSIELYFEFRFEEKLRSLWDTLGKAGVPSILHKIGSRPHLSIVILENCIENHVANLIEADIKWCPNFPITFPAIAFIPGKHQTEKIWGQGLISDYRLTTVLAI